MVGNERTESPHKNLSNKSAKTSDRFLSCLGKNTVQGVLKKQSAVDILYSVLEDKKLTTFCGGKWNFS